jgi:hypothetical protein
MSRARLRALQVTPVTPPDLLLRTFEPPPVRIRGHELGRLLAPGYARLAGADPGRDGD